MIKTRGGRVLMIWCSHQRANENEKKTEKDFFYNRKEMRGKNRKLLVPVSSTWSSRINELLQIFWEWFSGSQCLLSLNQSIDTINHGLNKLDLKLNKHCGRKDFVEGFTMISHLKICQLLNTHNFKKWEGGIWIAQIEGHISQTTLRNFFYLWFAESFLVWNVVNTASTFTVLSMNTTRLRTDVHDAR